MAEFAAAYGFPDPSVPWPLFLALVARVDRFDSRSRLNVLDSVRSAIGSALSNDPVFAEERAALFGAAYPDVERAGPIIIQNRFAAQGTEGGSDA